MRRDELHSMILAAGMQGLLYYCFAGVFYNVLSEKTIGDNLMLLAVIYGFLFVFMYIREKCRNLFLFLFLHAAAAGVFLFASHSRELCVAAGICIAGMLFSSVRLRTKQIYGRLECPLPAFGALFAVAYLAASDMDRPCLMQIFYYQAFIFFLMYVIYHSIENRTNFLKLNENIKNLPVREIKTVNRILLGVFIVLMIAGMIFVQYLLSEYLTGGLTGLMKKIMQIIISAVLAVLSWLSGHTDNLTEPAADQGMQMLPEAGEASGWLHVLEEVMLAAVFLLLAAGAVYFLLKILYKMYQKFYEQQRDTADESEFIWNSAVKKEHVKRKKGRKERLSGGNIDDKIRRMYKKYLRQQFGRKACIPNTMTPSELEDCIREQKNIAQKTAEKNAESEFDARQRTIRIALYEKARYGGKECGRQDLELMKQNLNMSND